MQRILRKTAFITIIFFISFTLAASNANTHQKLLTNAQFNNCPSPDLSSCTNISSPSTTPFIPNPQLNEQERFLSAIAHNLTIIPQSGTFEYILLRAYGAIFVKQNLEIKLPPKVILDNEQETQAFQSNLKMTKVNNTHDCYLQQPAAAAFNQAQMQANIPLKSGYGSGDCTRTFATNLRFWYKYANNQTLEKVRQGKETKILGLVAPPGTSQHLWGLAIDLRITNQKQREALNQNGWFQTVENDLPHWTYVSLSEENLPLFGFKKKVVRGITYWVTPL